MVRGGPSATGRRRWQLGRVPFAALLIVASCAAVAINVTFLPYEAPWPLPRVFDSQRAPCPAREDTRASLMSKPPDPARCSTDRIAYDRTRVEVRFRRPAGPAPVASDGGWQLVGSPGGLAIEDLNGLFAVPGTGQGLLDQSFGDIVYGTAGSRLETGSPCPWPPPT